MTSFIKIYDNFLSRITEEEYLETTEVETVRDLQDILLVAIPRFEFPRFDLFDYEIGDYDVDQTYQGVHSDGQEVPLGIWIGGYFNADLTDEEINILGSCMEIEWLGRQISTTELTKMRFSGSDYRLSSQANHMSKLKVWIDARKVDNLHLQRLYKRRKRTAEGIIQSTMGSIVAMPEDDDIKYNGVSAFWTSSDNRTFNTYVY